MPRPSLWLFAVTFAGLPAFAELPASDAVSPHMLLTVDVYSEGVVFDRAGAGYISHGPNLTRFTVDGEHSIWATLSNVNGHKVLPNGSHIVCDPGAKRLVRLAEDGSELEVVSDVCNGQPLRGPNDLSLDLANRGLYFTDPGGSSDTNPIGTVHYVNAEGVTTQIADRLAFPNGIILTPDGQRLLVAESRKNHILEYEVKSPGVLGGRKVFAKLPTAGEGQTGNEPDGMCLDAEGNVYVAHYGMGQVQVLSPQGELIRRYPTGLLRTSNVAFGGPQHSTLYVTGSIGGQNTPGGVAVLELNTPGLKILSLPGRKPNSPALPK